MRYSIYYVHFRHTYVCIYGHVDAFTLLPLPSFPSCFFSLLPSSSHPFTLLRSSPTFPPSQWALSCLPAHVQGPEHQLHLSIYDVYAVLIPILILLTFLPSFKYLAYAAYVGMVFLVVAMVVSDCVCARVCACVSVL